MRTGSLIGGFLRLLAAACALGSLAVLVAWALGRIVSDRALVTQYPAWIPTPVALVAAGAPLLFSAGLAAMAGGARRRARVARAARWCAAVLLLAAAADLLATDIGWSGPAGPGVLRAVVWNTAAHAAPDWPERVASQRPDIAVVVNPPSYAGLERIAEPIGPGAQTVTNGRFSMVSRFAVVRWCLVNLQLDTQRTPEPLLGRRLAPDPGYILYAELETTERLGRTTHLWIVDLPSDIRLPRRKVAEQLRSAAASWTGPMHLPTDDGRWRSAAAPEQGLPAPDLVVGDFNIPRDAWSLGVTTAGWTHAFDQAGRGWGGTFPRDLPIWHIDHAFVGPRLRATRYEIVDPGSSRHRMQVVEVQPAR